MSVFPEAARAALSDVDKPAARAVCTAEHVTGALEDALIEEAATASSTEQVLYGMALLALGCDRAADRVAPLSWFTINRLDTRQVERLTAALTHMWGR